MDVKKKLNVCIREMLFGERFLLEYKRDLQELFGARGVMTLVSSISASVAEEIEFSPVENSRDLVRFKKETISEAFFAERVKYNYPAYQRIVETITTKGHTGLSATISVYYALRYMQLQRYTAENETKTSVKDISASKKISEISDLDFRKKWSAEYRCEDGHYVRSKNEQLVDNWLYHHNVCHAYEALVVDRQTGKEYINDFYLPHLKLYIEVWGYETAEYLQRKKRKIETYQANKLKLLQMTDKEIKNLDDFMRRSLAAFNN